MATILLLLRSNTLKLDAALIPLISTMWLPDRESWKQQIQTNHKCDSICDKTLSVCIYCLQYWVSYSFGICIKYRFKWLQNCFNSAQRSPFTKILFSFKVLSLALPIQVDLKPNKRKAFVTWLWDDKSCHCDKGFSYGASVSPHFKSNFPRSVLLFPLTCKEHSSVIWSFIYYLSYTHLQFL